MCIYVCVCVQMRFRNYTPDITTCKSPPSYMMHQNTCSHFSENHRHQISKADKICYFSGRCLQASTETTCPRDKLLARVAPVKTNRCVKLSVQICLGRVLPASPISACRAALNMLKSLQCVLADGTDSHFTFNPSNWRNDESL